MNKSQVDKLFNERLIADMESHTAIAKIIESPVVEYDKNFKDIKIINAGKVQWVKGISNLQGAFVISWSIIKKTHTDMREVL